MRRYVESVTFFACPRWMSALLRRGTVRGFGDGGCGGVAIGDRCGSLSFDDVCTQGINEFDIGLGDGRASNDRRPAGHNIPVCDFSWCTVIVLELKWHYTRWTISASSW